MFIESRKIHHSDADHRHQREYLQELLGRLLATKPSSNDAGRTIQLDSFPSRMSLARNPVIHDEVAIVTKLSSTK